MCPQPQFIPIPSARRGAPWGGGARRRGARGGGGGGGGDDEGEGKEMGGDVRVGGPRPELAAVREFRDEAMPLVGAVLACNLGYRHAPRGCSAGGNVARGLRVASGLQVELTTPWAFPSSVAHARSIC